MAWPGTCPHLAPWEPWSRAAMELDCPEGRPASWGRPPNPVLTVELGYNLDENIQGIGVWEPVPTNLECGGVPKAHSLQDPV